MSTPLDDRQGASDSRFPGASSADAQRAQSEWWPVIYDCLHQLAVRALGRESPSHTLQPTALVHEAYVRLSGGSAKHFNDRTHFLAVASKVLREVLVDHARGKRAAKRGGGWQRITLDGASSPGSASPLDFLALDEALRQLGRDEERAAQVVELRFFGGLSIDETAEALGVSPRTVDKDWKFARAWLLKRLDGQDSSQADRKHDRS